MHISRLLVIAFLCQLTLIIWIHVQLEAATVRVYPAESNEFHADAIHFITFTVALRSDEEWGETPLALRFFNEKNQLLWEDAHVPQVGKIASEPHPVTLTYTFPIYVPNLMKDAEAHAIVKQNELEIPVEGTLDLKKASRAPEPETGVKNKLISGWYDLEKDAATGSLWRWMGKQSRLTLTNPYRPCKVLLKGWLPQKYLPQPNSLHVLINGNHIDTVISKSGDFIVCYELPLSLLGSDPQITVDLQVENIFRPCDVQNNNDTRELGMMLKLLYFQ